MFSLLPARSTDYARSALTHNHSAAKALAPFHANSFRFLSRLLTPQFCNDGAAAYG